MRADPDSPSVRWARRILPGSFALRPKLIMAFAAMALMTAICGTVGLFFVDRIGATVSLFSDVTSPLLTESTALVSNMERMRVAFFRGTTDGENPDELARKVAQLHGDNLTHLKSLRALATQAGIDTPLEPAEQREGEFHQTLIDLIAPYGRERSAFLTARDRVADFDAKLRKIEATLHAVANRADGRISKAEDETKVLVQTGAITLDGLADVLSDVLTGAYPVVNGANNLMRQTDQIDDAVKLLLAKADQTSLATSEAQVKRAFKAIGSIVKKLAGRLRDAEGQVELAAMRQGFAALETSLLGADGLLAIERTALEARADFTAGREKLEQIERAYVGILSGLELAVSRVNQDARLDAAIGISQARTLIAASVVLTMLAGIALALLFAHRITAPLMRLTDHVVGIRRTGELGTLSEASVVARTDEIGTLSRAFNLMIAELAEARQRLIAWSETEVRTQYERLNAAINNMPQGLCMFDADQRLIICNHRYAEIYGLPPELTVPGTPLRAILERRIAGGAAPVDEEDYIDNRVTAAAARKPLYIVNELRDGHVIAITHQPMRDGGSIATHEDITERRKAEAQIEFLAHHDALTRLPNRLRFREQIDTALSRTDRGEMVAVLCLDLDYFKAVNDTLGHPVGDALLRAAAGRVLDCVRPIDTVARLGGDEFAIVQVSVGQPTGATALATRLIEEISRPFDVLGHQVVVGVSVGVAVAPHDGRDPDCLLKNADMALYRAKEDGRGTYRFFEPDMDAKMQIRRALELDLRKALVQGQFELFYQPLVRVDTGRVNGFEALLRWWHPQRGLVLPGDFIPLAEEIGLIGPIGAWVLQQATAEATGWPGELSVAVNLSPVQFKGGAVVADVTDALRASGIAPNRLELEITEAVLLQDTDATVATLNELRALGVRISMDDFGTGYSSLGYLQKFPFDKIKIDRSFIHNLSDRPDSIAIVRAVTGLGSSLGISTTAEGVETQAQLQQLKDEGCTEVQGFLFSEPKPADQVALMLRHLDPSLKAVA
jgi:diguanylate cyclase (GGDEF)-like protein